MLQCSVLFLLKKNVSHRKCGQTLHSQRQKNKKKKIKITHNPLCRDAFNVVLFISCSFQCICVRIYKVDRMLCVVLVQFFLLNCLPSVFSLSKSSFEQILYMMYFVFLSCLFRSFIHFSIGMLMCVFILICKDSFCSKVINLLSLMFISVIFLSFSFTF